MCNIYQLKTRFNIRTQLYTNCFNYRINFHSSKWSYYRDDPTYQAFAIVCPPRLNVSLKIGIARLHTCLCGRRVSISQVGWLAGKSRCFRRWWAASPQKWNRQPALLLDGCDYLYPIRHCLSQHSTKLICVVWSAALGCCWLNNFATLRWYMRMRMMMMPEARAL